VQYLSWYLWRPLALLMFQQSALLWALLAVLSLALIPMIYLRYLGYWQSPQEGQLLYLNAAHFVWGWAGYMVCFQAGH